MIILLEGADCSGKTTLADAIRAAIPDAEYVHHTQDTNSILEFTHTINKAVEARSRGKWTIIDRLWISEMIYGPIMRNGNQDPEGIVARLCHMHGVITIMCVRRDIDKHIRHFRETSQTREEYAKDNIEAIIKAYHELWYGRLAGGLMINDDRSLYRFLSRFTPLQLLRSYYQYDIDGQYTAAMYVEWLKRMVSENSQ